MATLKPSLSELHTLVCMILNHTSIITRLANVETAETRTTAIQSTNKVDLHAA